MTPAFMSGPERRLITRDYEQGIKSPEAQRVTLVYRRYKPDTASNVEPVYSIEQREEDETPRRVSKVPCYQQIVSARTLHQYPQGYIEVGDAVFWFSQNLDLEELIPGDAMVPESFYVEDSSGNEWVPKLHDAEQEKEMLVLLEGDLQTGQPLRCYLRPHKNLAEEES